MMKNNPVSSNTVITPDVKANTSVIFQSTIESKEEIIKKLKQITPGFDESDFKWNYVPKTRNARMVSKANNKSKLAELKQHFEKNNIQIVAYNCTSENDELTIKLPIESTSIAVLMMLDLSSRLSSSSSSSTSSIPRLENKIIDQTKVSEHVKQIQSAIKKGTSFDKFVRRLKDCDAIDELIPMDVVIYVIGKDEFKITGNFTLLSYFVVKNDYDNVSAILTGKNAASPLKRNTDGTFPLYLAIQSIHNQPTYNPRIIDELLKYEPEKQAKITNNDGESALFLCVSFNRADLVKKIAAITPIQLFLTFARKNFSSPLFFAAEKGFHNVVKELLKYIPEQQVLNQNFNKMLPLHVTIQNNHFDVAETLLKHCPDKQLEAKTANNVTIFHYVIQSGNKFAVENLVKQFPALLNSHSAHNVSPLFIACKVKNFSLVKFFMEKAPNQLLFPNELGFIPLSALCAEGEEKIATELLKQNALQQIKHKEPEEYNAILSACYYGKLEILKIILKCLSAPTTSAEHLQELLLTRNNKGFTALHIAMLNPGNIRNYPSLEIAKELLRYIPEQQLVIQDNLGRTPLWIAVNENSVQAVKLLLQYRKPEQLLARHIEGYFPLFTAAQNGYHEVVAELLTQFSAEQSALTVNDWLPIHVASEYGYLEILRILETKYPGQVSRPGKDGLTPLHVSAYFKKNAVVRTLLEEYKVDRMAPSTDNSLALHLACQEGNIKAIPILLSHQAEQQLLTVTSVGSTVFHSCVSGKQFDILELISRQYPTIAAQLFQTKNIDGMTPLHLACMRDSLEIVTFCLEQGTDINAVSNKGWTPLHFASFEGLEKILNLLISRRAKLSEITTELGATPLHLATQCGHVKIVKKLLDCKGINIEAKDSYQRTSLIYAVVFNQHNIAKALIAKKADVNVHIVKDKQGITPLRLAVELYDLDMVKILMKAGANPCQTIEEDNITVIELVKEWDDIELKNIFLSVLIRSATSSSHVVSSATNINQLQSITTTSPTPKTSVSSRNYLKLLGFSDDELADFQEEQKQRQIELKKERAAHSNVAQVETIRANTEYSWFNGALSSESKELHLITNSARSNHYCYLPKNLLATQGCYLDNIEDLEFKFSNRHIKKLNDEKGIFSDKICLPNEVREVKYTHELKINRLDRILLFELQSDKKDACLYIASRYVESGLHVKAHIKSVKQSGITKSIPLLIDWPRDIGEIKGELEKATEKRTVSALEDVSEIIDEKTIFLNSAPIATSIEIPATNREGELKTKNIIPAKTSTVSDISEKLRQASAGNNLPIEEYKVLVNEAKKSNAINQISSNGKTALHWAADKGHREIVSILLAAKANVTLFDNKGWTALDYARENDDEKIGSLLKEAGATLTSSTTTVNKSPAKTG